MSFYFGWLFDPLPTRWFKYKVYKYTKGDVTKICVVRFFMGINLGIVCRQVAIQYYERIEFPTAEAAFEYIDRLQGKYAPIRKEDLKICAQWVSEQERRKSVLYMGQLQVWICVYANVHIRIKEGRCMSKQELSRQQLCLLVQIPPAPKRISKTTRSPGVT